MRGAMSLQTIRMQFVTSTCCISLLIGGLVRSNGDEVSAGIVAVQDLLADQNLQLAVLRAKSKEDKKRLNDERATIKAELPGMLIQLAEKNPKSTGGLAALYWAAFLPATSDSQTASKMFQERTVSAELDQLATAIRLGRQGSQEFGGDLEIARALLDRVKKRTIPREGSRTHNLCLPTVRIEKRQPPGNGGVCRSCGIDFVAICFQPRNYKLLRITRSRLWKSRVDISVRATSQSNFIDKPTSPCSLCRRVCTGFGDPRFTGRPTGRSFGTVSRIP